MPKPDVPIHPEILPRLVKTGPIGYREDSLFTDKKGNEKSGIRKRAEDALAKLRAPLEKLIGPDEIVLYVTRAQAPISTFEQWTMGWNIYAVSRCILVVTNKRLLEFRARPGMFSSDLGWKWRGTGIRSIAWGGMKEAKIKGWLSAGWHLVYHSGKKERYWGLRGQDAKKIRLIAETLLPLSTGESTAAQEPVVDCPACGKELRPGDYRCNSCGQQFKDPRTATIRSILIPGGGYFYVGQHLFGALDAFFESMFLLVALLLLGEIAGVFATGEGETSATWDILIYILVVLALEKLVTIYHARKAVETYIPVKS